MSTQRRIAVIGLGYVGLPVAVAFAERFPGTIGFDINTQRIEELRAGIDRTREVEPARLATAALELSDDAASLVGADFFVVTVPTPIDDANRPDLSALRAASETVGKALRPGAIVVYESTVYPGVTEQFCGPILERASGLRSGREFALGYSPERINPGDREHGFERITKVVSAQDQAALDVVADVYAAVVHAGIHRAPSIQVAEAAKVIENTQRDLNIALMNELALVFDRLGIDTLDVLAAAGTKWNFLPFTPGLVGGHCIGVDPYYLTTRAEQVGVHPQIILAGRRLNDSMSSFVAQRTVKQLISAGTRVSDARVLVMGLTFKPDVPDIRNSRVPAIIDELRDYGIVVEVIDPHADADEVRAEYGLELVESPTPGFDAIVLAVPHAGLAARVVELAHSEPAMRVLIDIKGAVDRSALPERVRTWRL